jgi:hypothetical protein
MNHNMNFFVRNPPAKSLREGRGALEKSGTFRSKLGVHLEAFEKGLRGRMGCSESCQWLAGRLVILRDQWSRLYRGKRKKSPDFLDWGGGGVVKLLIDRCCA